MNTTSTVAQSATSTLASLIPSVTSKPKDDGVPAHGASPVVAFLIGLSIILLASIMNAAGLNLTKYDHVWGCYLLLVCGLTADALAVGADERNTQGGETERLVEAYMAPWDVAVYVSRL